MLAFFKDLFSNRAFVVLSILVISLGFTLVVLKMVTETYPSGLETASSLTTSVRNIIQSIFFAITAVLAVISFFQAKKTLFNPLRTEIFKLQIKELEHVLNSINEPNHFSSFDFYSIIRYNYIAFLADRFPEVVDFNNYSLLSGSLRNSIVGSLDLENMTTSVFKELTMESLFFPGTSNEDELNPATSEESQSENSVLKVYYTDKFLNRYKLFTTLIASPILPIELKTKLSEYK